MQSRFVEGLSAAAHERQKGDAITRIERLSEGGFSAVHIDGFDFLTVNRQCVKQALHRCRFCQGDGAFTEPVFAQRRKEGDVNVHSCSGVS